MQKNVQKNVLESFMKLNGDTGADIAHFLGITRSTFSLKINARGAEFTQGEILAMKSRYNLTAEDVDRIFFTRKCS